MEEEKIKLLQNKLKKDISKIQLYELSENLAYVSDSKYEEIEAVKLKSAKTTVILSAVLGVFGAGSFYLGHTVRGILKIVFNVLVPLLIYLVFLVYLSPLHQVYCEQSYNIYAEINEPTNSVISVQTAFNAAYANYVKDIENEDDVLEYIEARVNLETQKDLFVNKGDYFKNIHTKLADGLNEIVDKKLKFNKTLSEVNTLFSELQNEADINIIKEKIDAVSKNLSDLQTKSYDDYFSYRFSYNFLNLFFGWILIVDGYIIEGYWVFEIFNDRKKCHNQNYEIIKKLLKV